MCHQQNLQTQITIVLGKPMIPKRFFITLCERIFKGESPALFHQQGLMGTEGEYDLGARGHKKGIYTYAEEFED